MNDENDNEKPVAYDVQGHPLYLHPEDNDNDKPKVQTVHIARPTELDKPVLSEEVKLKHDRSTQLYPNLNLSKNEYVIRAVKRHPVGLFIPVLLGAIVIAVLLAFLVNFDLLAPYFSVSGHPISFSSVLLPVFLAIIFTLALVYAAYYVYYNNRFYLTNESVIQVIQLTLLSKHEQTLSLADVEDVSYFRSSLFQQLFDYGTIRLSTIGDEDTYTFTFVASPRDYIATLNNAVEAFKNGRPVDSQS